MTVKVSLRDLHLAFPGRDGAGDKVIYENLNLDIDEGSFTVLLGPSGCGKSTLLNITNGLLKPTSASGIIVDGNDLRDQPEMSRKMAYVFQGARLLRWKTLAQNAEFGLAGLNVQPKEKWQGLMEKYFSAVGLKDYMNHYPHQVSGGMQQRASIVRAWVNEPEILLMDEPFSHLDEITAATMRRILIDLWRQDETRRTIIFVTHDIAEAAQMASDIVMLTPAPSSICYRRKVDMPWPRAMESDEVIDLEKELRRAFSEKAGIRF
ncbi:ABC transporter ATP-binding protein [Acuticoccus yangtzensis]|uniref:ABC transporter ATP-binding protein n=1 Tax=Acuticoccus yangtzensis TaxID=1443441 RepID=UPI0009496273|nr:ATP-binding cassette domain-containing protein [Acuticoccus yangtzensis]ORE94249.1 nitrate/sulfonate/bicarbonate transport system ABC transporter ATP-binding protein [Stappia sp. 22II-S9-Z10]